MIFYFKKIIEIIGSYFSKKEIVIGKISKIKERVRVIISTDATEPEVRSEFEDSKKDLIDLNNQSRNKAIFMVSDFQSKLYEKHNVQSKILVLGNRNDTLRVIQSTFKDSFIEIQSKKQDINEAIYFLTKHLPNK